MSKNVAILRIAAPLLLERLGLPMDTVLQDCKISFDLSGVVEFKIEHNSLMSLQEGMAIPAVSAVFGPSGFIRFA